MSDELATCLIASPFLDDPNFFRTVILMIAKGEEGAMGLVLNRPTQSLLTDVLPPLTKELCVHDGVLYSGGPVTGPLVALHDVASLSERECCTGLHFTSNRQHMKHLSRLTDIRLRVFDGYAGWGPGQLEEEVDQGGWLWTELSLEDALGPAANLWKTLLQKVGRNVIQSAIDIDRIPDDPSLN